jgi:hypothetical protein
MSRRTTILIDERLDLELAEMQIKVRRAWGRRFTKGALADMALRRYLDDIKAALERGEAPPAGLLPDDVPASDTPDTPESTEAP